jgi:hypothetical protein
MVDCVLEQSVYPGVDNIELEDRGRGWSVASSSILSWTRRGMGWRGGCVGNWNTRNWSWRRETAVEQENKSRHFHGYKHGACVRVCVRFSKTFWQRKRKGTYRKVYNEEYRNLNSSRNSIRVIRSRRIRWTEHVVCMTEKHEEERKLGVLMDLEENRVWGCWPDSSGLG